MTVEYLDGETEYESRALATNDDGAARGETLSFVTGAAEIGQPTIESLRVEDTSGPNPHVDLEVSGNVSHPDGVLDDVRLTVRDGNDKPEVPLRSTQPGHGTPDRRRSE